MRTKPVLSGGVLGSSLTTYVSAAGKLNVFLLARTTAGCDRVEKYVSVCMFF